MSSELGRATKPSAKPSLGSLSNLPKWIGGMDAASLRDKVVMALNDSIHRASL